MKRKSPTVRWGALWYSKNKLDGITSHIVFKNLMPALFLTKKEAKEFIKKEYGYIAKRKDLRGEPFGWRMPKPVRIMFSVFIERKMK